MLEIFEVKADKTLKSAGNNLLLEGNGQDDFSFSNYKFYYFKFSATLRTLKATIMISSEIMMQDLLYFLFLNKVLERN